METATQKANKRQAKKWRCEGSTVKGVAQADILVTDEFGCQVVYID